MIKIFSNYRRVYITRNGQTFEVTCGDEITQDEFATMICEGDVECIHQITGDLVKFSANALDKQTAEVTPTVTAADVTTAPVAQSTPAPDAGLVPVPVDTGTKAAKA